MRHNRSFTLIELLVVIAIIAILAGMLMPALAKVKSVASLSTCAGNLKQVMTGAQNYMNTYDIYVPSYMMTSTGKVTYYWYALIGNELGWNPVNGSRFNALYRPAGSEARTPSIFMCPNGIWSSNGDNYFYGTISYACQVTVFWDGGPAAYSTPTRVAKVKQPSARAFIYDAGLNNCYVPGQGGYSTISTNWDHAYIKPYPDDVRYGRHGQKNNILCFDGHTENMTSEKMYWGKIDS